ncbi:MAG: DUF2029 domain-containing protein [Verrucomicrobiales bacterium]|nr:DUF2029 domain-containing protein [Verrucomicrobiales bacterium]
MNDDNTTSRKSLIVAALIWLLPFLVITVMVIHKPEHRTVMGTYCTATDLFWNRADMYQPKEVGPGDTAFVYLPQAAILFTPFTLMPRVCGEVLFRALMLGLLAHGIWRVTQTFFSRQRDLAFLLLSLVAMPISLGALRNAQANVLLAAISLYIMAALAGQKYWSAALWMGFSVVVKPLLIPLIGLAVLSFPAVLVPLLVTMSAALALPFLFAAPDYVINQYALFWQMVTGYSATVERWRYADISGVIYFLGGDLSPWLSRILRFGAGLVFLALALFGIRKTKDVARQALWIGTLGGTYLMLFNLATEKNSYVIIAPFLGLWATMFFQLWKDKLRGGMIVGLVASMALLPTIFWSWLHNRFGIVWFPLMMIMFLGLVVQWWFCQTTEE